MKKLICVIVLLINNAIVFGETFEFKDGTKVKGKILYSKERDTFNINGKGLHLIVEGGLYVHDYPYTRSISETYVPRPPSQISMNPAGLPTCLPTRINFIQFSRHTIRDIVWHYEDELKHNSNKYSSNDVFNMSKAIQALHKAYDWKPRNKYELRTPVDTRAWNYKVQTKLKPQTNAFVYGKSLRGRTNMRSCSP